MLIDKSYEITVNSRNVKRYEELGYKVPKRINKYNKEVYATGEKMMVNVNDLPSQANILVEVICDYCGKSFKMLLDNRYKYYNKGIIKKDACFECGSIKSKEALIEVYGVENVMQLKEFKEKMFKTNIELYGVKMPIQNEDIKNKAILTCLKRYGVINPSMNKEIYDKIKQTNIEKYGFKCVLQNKEIRAKANITLYKNGTAPCSKQQKYICDVLDGKLNFPIDRCLLDIAFPKEMVYIEYDGGGHDLSVKLGNITEKEFNIKEIKRYKFLKSLGWKQIKIISKNDFVLNKEDLINCINNAKNELIQNNKNHVNIVLDKNNNEYELIKI